MVPVSLYLYQHLLSVCFFLLRSFNGSGVMSHDFDMYLPNDVEHIFMCSFFFYVLFSEISTHIFFPFPPMPF